MKNVNDIIKSIKENLKELGSPLANTPTYSNAYILFRSIAQVINKQYTDLDNYYANSFLSTSVGSNLDSRVKDFNIYRQQGSPSTGFVFASSTSNITVIQGTILNSPNSSYQFQTTSEYTVNNTGVYIPITSLVNTELTNLNAGTILYSPYYPSVKFIVANAVDLSGNYIGGLTGGASPESDDSLRKRALVTISNQPKGTLSSIATKLQELGLTRYYIKESYPVPGYFTVYVTTNDQSTLDLIESSLIEVKPIGVAFEVKPLSFYSLDIRLVISLSSSNYSQSAIQQIRTLIYNYVNNLELGEIFYPNNVDILSANVPGITDVRIIEPTSSKVVPPKDSLIKVRSIYFTINGEA